MIERDGRDTAIRSAWRRHGRFFGRLMLAAGVIACLVVLAGMLRSDAIDVEFDPGAIASILLANLLAVCFNFLAWRRLVFVATGFRVSFVSGIHGQALLMVGKYVPGKVFGITGRALTLGGGVTARSAITLVLVEQFYLVTGLCVVALTLWLSFVSSTSGWMALPVLLLFVGWAPRLAGALLAPFAGRLAWVMPDSALLARIAVPDSFRLQALAVVSAASVSFVVWWVPDLLGMPLNGLERVRLVAAYAIAVVAGMAAVVLPGGIGVREGAFVLFAGPVVGGEAAVAMSAILRIITVGVDLVMGILAVVIRGVVAEGRA